MTSSGANEPFIAASEERNEIPESGFTRTIIVEPHTRLFRVSDELASRSLLDWSGPVQLKLDRREDGSYDLIARMVAMNAQELIAQARRELWWFIEHGEDEIDGQDAAAKAIYIQDELLAPALDALRDV